MPYYLGDLNRDPNFRELPTSVGSGFQGMPKGTVSLDPINVRALIIRRGFWGLLYTVDDINPAKP